MPTTRFYLPSSGAAAVTPANAAWDKTTGAGSALAAVRTKISSAMATVTNTKDSTTLHSSLIRQYVTEPLGSQTITGHISGAMRCIESNIGFSACVAVSIRACSQDGTTIRSPALLAISNSDLYTSGTVHEMANALTNRLLEDVNEATSITLTSCTLSDGDRLIFEFGYKSSDTSTTRTGGISFGDDSATDLSSTDTTVTVANNPWIEFDTALVFDRSLALSGLAGTAAVDAPLAADSLAISGGSATSAVGTVTPSTTTDLTLALTGVEGTSAAGSVTESFSLQASGLGASTATGSVALSVGLTPGGVQAVSAADSASKSFSLAVDGLGAAAAADSVAAAVGLAVSGSVSTGHAGSFAGAPSDGEQALTGGLASADLGAMAAEAAVPSIGTEAAATIDLALAEIEADLSGESALADAGTIIPPHEVLSGMDAVTDLGLLLASRMFWISAEWTETYITERE